MAAQYKGAPRVPGRAAYPAKRQRVMDALMQMTKLDIAALQAAYEGK